MLKNELLQQALTKVQEGVSNREVFDKLVRAGTKVIYNQQTFSKLTEGLADSQDPVGDIAKGMVAVLHMMAQKARGTIPQDVLVQAGIALLIDALDFAEQSGLVKIGKEELTAATTQYIEALLPTVGMTPQKMGGMLEGVKQTMADPQRMAEFQASMKGGAK